MNLETHWTAKKKLLNQIEEGTPRIGSPLAFSDFYLYHCPKCDIELYHCSLYYFSRRRLSHCVASWLLLTFYFVILK